MAYLAPRYSKTSFSGGYLLCLFLILFSVRTSAFFWEWGKDLEGPWCAQRPRGQDCCNGRDDLCAVPILGTECYCDVFCNDTAFDCCPDYFSHCLGLQTPTTTPKPTTLLPPRTTRSNLDICYRDGKTYTAGAVIKNNCNKCTCGSVGRWDCTDDVCLIRPELIKEINDGPYTWEAGNYSNLWGLTLDEGTRFRLGTFKLQDEVVGMTPIRVFEERLPESFDARQRWPNLISPITDQGNCGSSWAHSTTTLMSDRFSIQSDGAAKDLLSIQHLLSCNNDGQMGCNGGHLDRAWWFLRKTGVVSEKCYPYTMSRHDDPNECLISDDDKDAECPSKVSFKRGKRFHATPPYRIRPAEKEIRQEISDNGPVQAIFQVHEDFFMYRSGVYKYTDLINKRNEPEKFIKSGFHSVRIIGWGTDESDPRNPIKYWICANSWGPEWGEDGYFRIQRGTDESFIESFVIGVIGSVSGDEELRVLMDRIRRQRERERRLRVNKPGRGRRQLRKLKTAAKEVGEKKKKTSGKQQRRHRRHNLNKIESYMDDDYTTGRTYRFYKPKNRRTKSRIYRKGKKYWKLNRMNAKKT